ncbi:MAG: hypothetical protein ABS76_30380 [Pelagibacterium sp. SCN 64-44]|nr:MAG: hypothetical protein ABS76_30380 [Pelagibacterium sp. SCN 64-44]
MALSLSGERPLAAAAPANPVRALRRWLAEARQARLRRMALKALLDLDNVHLRDMGISRRDIHAALQAPAHSGRLLHGARARSARL